MHYFWQSTWYYLQGNNRNTSQMLSKFYGNTLFFYCQLNKGLTIILALSHPHQMHCIKIAAFRNKSWQTGSRGELTSNEYWIWTAATSANIWFYSEKKRWHSCCHLVGLWWPKSLWSVKTQQRKYLHDSYDLWLLFIVELLDLNMTSVSAKLFSKFCQMTVSLCAISPEHGTSFLVK